MSIPHRIGVKPLVDLSLEGVDLKFMVEGVLRAQQKSKQAFAAICSQFVEGTTEVDAYRIAVNTLADFGAKKSWHRACARFGSGTLLPSSAPMQREYRLQPGDIFYLDLGPVWNDEELGLQYEGDFGDTLVLGTNAEAEKCAQTCRELFALAQEQWAKNEMSGKALYNFLAKEAAKRGYKLDSLINGHRTADFPHHRYSKYGLGDVEITPEGPLWILEVQIYDRKNNFGAFFKDVLGETKIERSNAA